MFPEFYRPSSDDEHRFVTEGTVVVDTNVLLGLYEFSVHQRNEALSALEKIGHRLWIPYQVGLEYQRNRLSVIRRQAGHYEGLVRLVGLKTAADLEASLGHVRVPDEVADEVRVLLPDLAARLSKASSQYIRAVEMIQDRHVVTAEQGSTGDPVRERLDALFEGNVGAPPGDADRAKRITEANRRRENRVPPGYKDDDKPGEEDPAGDYLLWAELLDHAEATKDDRRPFLFVTNDVKEDWYEKSAGKPIGARPELVREFHSRNPNGYHQVTLESLLRLAREHLEAEVDDATIEKASELSRPDLEAILRTSDRRLARRLLDRGIPPDGVAQILSTMRDRAENEFEGPVGREARRALISTMLSTLADTEAGRKRLPGVDPHALEAALRVLNDPELQLDADDLRRRINADRANDTSRDVRNRWVRPSPEDFSEGQARWHREPHDAFDATDDPDPDR